MKVGEAIKEAVERGDAHAAGQISDFLRWKGLDYEATYQTFNRITGITRAGFEALMYESDA